MPNRNYRSGRSAEYRAKRMLLARGHHTVVRSAGSKGPFDLIGLGPDRVTLVQVKRGRPITKAERLELMSFTASLPGMCILEIWYFAKGSTPSVETL